MQILKRKNIEIGALIIVALILIVLDISGITSLVAEATLAILVFIAFHLIRMGERLDEIESQDELRAIDRVYERSSELPPLEDVLTNAKTEIVFWGSVIGHVINQRNLVTKKLAEGVTIRVLFMSYQLEDGTENPLVEAASDLSTGVNMRTRLQTTHNEFETFLSSLQPQHAQLLEVRVFDTFPTAAYLFVDKESQRGIARLTPSLYGFEPGTMPSFEFSRRSATYENLVRSFQTMWSEARPFAPLHRMQ